MTLLGNLSFMSVIRVNKYFYIRFISMTLKIIIFIILIQFFGCNNNSSATATEDEVGEITKKEYSVYFLGNSITLHSPNPEIGWYGNWGMAATSEENDYVHKIINKIKNESKDYFNISYGLRNISDWERNFYIKLDTLEINEIDLLIIRLGENVNEEYAMNNNYYEALNNLIKRYKENNTQIIITDNYWPSVFKDGIQKKVAIDNNYFFVQINDLYSNAENSAFGQFEHSGVAGHPSDIGMENIALRLFECIIENEIIK